MKQTQQESTFATVSDTPRIRVRALGIQRQQTSIINQLSFDVRAGEVLGLIGPNGAGKSTILASIAGIEKHNQGSIEIDGKKLSSISNAQRAQTLAWVEQAGQVHWPLSVEQLVMLGRTPYQSSWSTTSLIDAQAVERALVHTDCLTIRHQSVSTLSGGERARALLARALASCPTILLADEPVASLDLAHQLQTMQLLRNHASGGHSTVVVLHDLSLAARYCDRILLLHKGERIALGEPAAVLTDQNIADVYGVSVIAGCSSIPWIVPEYLLKP